jgi:DNA-binding NarL/FixJ family response regulator
MTEIRIHITDDHVVCRCGLKAFIERQADLKVVSEATYCHETLERIRKNKPDIAILDINDPRHSAPHLAQILLGEQPKLPLLILTIIKEEHYLREFLRIGARGFMMKTSTGDDLIDAIYALSRGEPYIDSQLSSYLVSSFIGQPQKTKFGVGLLTSREREICRYLATGYTNAEVAFELNISKRTVETHRAAIMSKLGLKSRAELVHFSMENGLLAQAEFVTN